MLYALMCKKPCCCFRSSRFVLFNAIFIFTFSPLFFFCLCVPLSLSLSFLYPHCAGKRKVEVALLCCLYLCMHIYRHDTYFRRSTDEKETRLLKERSRWVRTDPRTRICIPLCLVPCKIALNRVVSHNLSTPKQKTSESQNNRHRNPR